MFIKKKEKKRKERESVWVGVWVGGFGREREREKKVRLIRHVRCRQAIPSPACKPFCLGLVETFIVV